MIVDAEMVRRAEEVLRERTGETNNYEIIFVGTTDSEVRAIVREMLEAALKGAP